MTYLHVDEVDNTLLSNIVEENENTTVKESINEDVHDVEVHVKAMLHFFHVFMIVLLYYLFTRKLADINWIIKHVTGMTI